MEKIFTPAPHKEAVALIAGKPVMVKRVFNQLLPELRARAFTVAGIESANCLQRIRAAVSAVPTGGEDGLTWDQAKRQIVDELDPYLGDGADYRAELVLRVNTFQAYSASIHEVAHADADTTHLQYLHGECEVPTPSHLALNGVTLPKNDPFWATHTGPWGHLGCVCYVRPMNSDLVDEERKKDETRNPEDRNVIEGPALKKLNEGEILRNGQRYDVSYDGPDNSGFKWTPGDFKIPLKDLEKKYDPDVWSTFQAFAQKTPLDEKQSVWDWLSSAPEKLTLANAAEKGDELYDNANRDLIRADSERFFSGGQKAFGRFQSVWGAALEAEVLRSVEEEWSAQIAAAATGRKPLFHESIGSAAPHVAAELRKILPASVEVQATDSDIFVYRPEALEKFANASSPLWPQVQAHANDGLWLGYGANFPTDQTVLVKIVDPSGKTKSGFYAPVRGAEKYAAQRAGDFTLATGIKHEGVIVKK
jgi:hypothetical protein